MAVAAVKTLLLVVLVTWTLLFQVTSCAPETGKKWELRGDGIPIGDRPPHPNAGRIDPKAKIGSQMSGGLLATRGQFPWSALLVMTTADASGNRYCGGALIDRQWVLTSARCVYGRSTNIMVMLGAQDISVPETGRQNFTTSCVVIHPCSVPYPDYSLHSDLALIKLPSLATISMYVNTVLLPTRSMETNAFVGQTAYSSGWGKVGNETSAVTNKLNWMSNPVISNAECSPNYLDLLATHLCVKKTGTQEMCWADLGGPLVYSNQGLWTLIGISSFSYIYQDCGNMIVPNRYQRLTSYLTWISSVTNLQIKP